MFVWAPKTRHYFKSRPVFVQSVPKSGTHVVFECLKAFGYAEPPSLDLPHFDAPFEDGVFYNLQHMPYFMPFLPPINGFAGFVDSLSRSVTVFIVRDPRDTAVSLAHYLAVQTNYHHHDRLISWNAHRANGKPRSSPVSTRYRFTSTAI